MKVEEYVYDEEKYISSKDFSHFDDLMDECDYQPELIQDKGRFNMVLQYLVSQIERSPDFLPSYEYAVGMLNRTKLDKELSELRVELLEKWAGACNRIAEKENIFNKVVLWGWQENRPLIRGLFFEANRLWGEGKIADAHELFSKILRTNSEDNVGARYSVKATGEGMTLEEFEERFTYSDADGTYYKNEELQKWFGE